LKNVQVGNVGVQYFMRLSVDFQLRKCFYIMTSYK